MPHRSNISLIHQLQQRSQGQPYLLHLTSEKLSVKSPQTEPDDKPILEIIPDIPRIEFDNESQKDDAQKNEYNDDMSSLLLDGRFDSMLRISDSSWESNSMMSCTRPRHCKSVTVPILSDCNSLTEVSLPLSSDDNNRYGKIFCSEWVNNHQIAFGTKCDHLLLYDTEAMEVFPIFKLSPHSISTDSGTDGVRTVASNPSGSLLATVGKDSHTVAVYTLPNLTPVGTGASNVHTDFIFDICWIDDSVLAVACRDGYLSIWRFDQSNLQSDLSHVKDFSFKERGIIEFGESNPFPRQMNLLDHKYMQPKLRAISHCNDGNTLLLLSPNSSLIFYDYEREMITNNMYVQGNFDNVCLTYDNKSSLAAIGTKNGFYLLDNRLEEQRALQKFECSSSHYTRSVNFLNFTLSVSSSEGSVDFYDIRRLPRAESGPCDPYCSIPMLSEDDGNTVFTHCFDRSLSQMFAAGGPLNAHTKGSFAHVFI